LQKTGNGETLTVAQFNRGAGIAHREGRNHGVLNDDGVGEIGFADRRLDPQVDDAWLKTVGVKPSSTPNFL